MRRILHISDIHFGPHHAPRPAEGVLALVERRRPDLVVISGDLTQRAKPQQFREARAWVDRIGAPTVVVPGNHDVPMYRVWERVFSRYGAYRKYFAHDLEPIFEADGLLVIGINTAFNWTIKGGRMRSSRLRQVAALLDAAPAGAVRIVVAHHELVPAPRFRPEGVMRGARAAVRVFAEHGVDLVLSGHLHQAYCTTSDAYYPETHGSPFLIVHTGTTTSHRGRGCERLRYTCNWIRIEDRRTTVSHLRWDDEAAFFEERSRHCYPRRHRERYALGPAWT